jgi:UDPglucose 6-dehydrogenase
MQLESSMGKREEKIRDDLALLKREIASLRDEVRNLRNNKPKLGIVGFGVIGKALHHVLQNNFQIFIYDKYKEQYSDINILVKNSEIIFLSVPTPMKPSGEIGLEHVEDSLKEISYHAENGGRCPIVVIRSSVVPGTTEKFQRKYSRLRLVFNPEYLTEKNSMEDMENTDRIVIGTSDMDDAEKVRAVYLEVFPNAKYIITDSRTAEMAKYASNVTLASQVTVANEIYQICMKLGIEYKTVKNILLLDKRIGTSICVPGEDGELGFGGKCLPKDFSALVHLSRKIGYKPELLEQVWRTNLKLRGKKDWLAINGATFRKKLE